MTFLDAFALGVQFERRLDPAQRARLGAYYTPREDILLLVDSVLMRPLRRMWGEIQTLTPDPSPSRRGELFQLRAGLLRRLRTITVLDPACGLGNFLVVALECLQELEREVIQSPLWRKLPQETPQVNPRQMFGIEKDPAACALARAILGLENATNIQCGDALFSLSPSTVQETTVLTNADLSPLKRSLHFSPLLNSGEGPGVRVRGEVDWPAVDVILSNPPFLGSRKLRPELGDAYVDALVSAYGETFGKRTPDLVCYWFERARRELERGRVQRVGFIATNSIRGGSNRRVLERIAQTGSFFMAWSDRDWMQDGATVNVSIVAFDGGEESEILLDGHPASHINPDLSEGIDLTPARRLPENRQLAFQGIIRRGPFDLPEASALSMIQADSANTAVLRRIYNGDDLTSCARHRWVIDFGCKATLEEAQRFAEPFTYVEGHVRPARGSAKQQRAREHWWLHWNPRPAMRHALAPLARYLATPAISKHRVFVWIDKSVHPDHALIVFAREDDYFFGVLHSSIHQLWALRLGTSLENRPRYTPTTVFETFPFPFPPGEEDPNHPAYLAISTAARALHEARQQWLHGLASEIHPTLPQPSPLVTGMIPHAPTTDVFLPLSNLERGPGGEVKARTLTHVYNALQCYRQNPVGTHLAASLPTAKSRRKFHADALEFAPRLDQLHRALDAAVCAAYGWHESILEDEQAILTQLLAQNLTP